MPASKLAGVCPVNGYVHIQIRTAVHNPNAQGRRVDRPERQCYRSNMKYNGVILKKFAVMAEEIARLRDLGEVTTAQLDDDHFLKHGVERALQICVEIVIDVAPRILSLEGRSPAPTALDALDGLVSMHVIASAERYREMIQFRNFVVHRYERVDSGVLVAILNRHLDDLTAFRDEVAGVS